MTEVSGTMEIVECDAEAISKLFGGSATLELSFTKGKECNASLKSSEYNAEDGCTTMEFEI